MIATIMFIHDNPGCTRNNLSEAVPESEENLDILASRDLISVESDSIRLTDRGRNVASHLLSIEELMGSK